MKWIIIFFVLHFPILLLSQNLRIDSLNQTISISEDRLEKAELSLELALEWREVSSDSSLSYFKKASFLFDTLSHSILSTKYYYHQAEVYLDIGMHDRALMFLDNAMNDSVTDTSDISIPDILDKKADVKIRNGEYSDATELLMNVVPIFQRIDDKAGLSGAYNSLGTVMERSKQLDKALEYYEKAYQAGMEAGTLRPAHGYLTNMAIAHSMKGEHEKAIPLLQKVIDFAKTRNENRLEALASGNLGRVYVFIKEFGKAEVLILRSLQLFKKMGHHRGVAAASSQLSRVYFAQGKNREIIDLLKPQYEFVKEQNFVKFQEHIADNLRKAYKSLEDYENALFFTEELSAIKDSTVTKEMAQTVNDAETKYQAKEKEAQIERLALEDKINQIRINQQQYGLWSFSLVIALLSYFFYRIFGQKREIDKQHKEKEVLLKEIHHRVKNNLQVISSLLKLQSKNVTDTATQKVLAEGQSRVRSMALIHQNLYQEDNLTGIHMPSYLKELSEELVENYNQNSQSISLKMDLEDIYLDVDTVVPIGLIINELVTNSVKYAFKNVSNPEISLILKKESDRLRLMVSDNGTGFNPKNINKKSLGMRLIHSFAKRLKADFVLDGSNGTIANFLIKDYS